MEEEKSESKVYDDSEQYISLQDEINTRRKMLGLPSSEELLKLKELEKEKEKFSTEITRNQFAVGRNKAIKSGVDADKLASSDETTNEVKKCFSSGKTPSQSSKELASNPKADNCFNRAIKYLFGDTKKALDKKSDKNLTDIVSKTLISTGGPSLSDVTDNNVGSSLSKIVVAPEYQAEIKKIESSIGSKFISNLPYTSILCVMIAILVLVVEERVSPAAAVQAAAQQLSGCYMIYGDGKVYDYVKLDGCSDWYSENTNNLLNCRCNNINDASKPIDCKGNDKDLPYCIGTADDTTIEQKKCINPKDKNTPPTGLLKCQGEVGKNGTFVSYTSNFDDALDIITKCVSLLITTKGDTYNPSKNLTEKFGLVEKIAIAIGIIIILLILGLTIYNVFSKKK